MPTLVFELRVEASPERVWEFHSTAEALYALTPPDRKLTPLSDDIEVRNGALHQFRVTVKGVPVVWKARISNVIPPRGFVDTAEKSPFAKWVHRRSFLPDGEGTVIRDEVEYEPPFGPIGRVADALFIRKDIERLWRFRHSATKSALDAKPK